LTRKNPSPIWPIMCWWDVKPYSINQSSTAATLYNTCLAKCGLRLPIISILNKLTLLMMTATVW